MGPDVRLSQRDYEAILKLNQEHGRTMFCDLYVDEKFSQEVFVMPPKTLPSVVIPRRGFNWFLVGKHERIEGIESLLHGMVVWYEKVWDKEDRLRQITRHEENVASPLRPIDAHYHVSVLDHYAFDIGLGRPLIGLGNDISGFDDALDRMYHEVLLYHGEITEPEPQSVYQRKRRRPLPELGIPTFREFIMGFRQGLVTFEKGELLPRIEQLLDQLT